MNFSRFLLPYFMLFPLALQAQTQLVKPVSESELRACLLAEKEGMEQFEQLAKKANELKIREQQLAQRRIALQDRQSKLEKRSIRQTEVEELNRAVTTFNQQSDQLNADKIQFEGAASSNAKWMDNNVRPTCDPIRNRPIGELTSFYACGFDTGSALATLPHCSSLPNIENLKTCVQKAGQKSAALAACTNPTGKP